ncbi:hypothetical protein [Alicyclobacillus sp. SO9]|uniref:hypothetical protein n=1 Tax=Alicyclobacillus sp. SO9 TaxID=2665646 RepID=UPI0018E6DED4|nr:hypothetical protein [Alicyclobacillus sp. SO9]QQE80457.1 hypothetical protein GI364_08615 [Alicyclobacillus sp. SO9]
MGFNSGKEQVIVRVVGEGGSITLWGRQELNGDWNFALGRDESGLADFLDDEDEVLLVSRPRNWVQSFEEGLALLDRYPWKRLSPRWVHEDFRRRVLREVKRDGLAASRIERWVEVCGGQ